MADDHNCVRNPETGACYVCNTPMRLNYSAVSPLDKIIDATQHPQAAPTAHNSCACGAYIPANETQCFDCWSAQYTRQPAPQPKPVKQTKPAPLAIDLDSIIASMETNPDRWN